MKIFGTQINKQNVLMALTIGALFYVITFKIRVIDVIVKPQCKTTDSDGGSAAILSGEKITNAPDDIRSFRSKVYKVPVKPGGLTEGEIVDNYLFAGPQPTTGKVAKAIQTNRVMEDRQVFHERRRVLPDAKETAKLWWKTNTFE